MSSERLRAGRLLTRALAAATLVLSIVCAAQPGIAQPEAPLPAEPGAAPTAAAAGAGAENEAAPASAPPAVAPNTSAEDARRGAAVALSEVAPGSESREAPFARALPGPLREVRFLQVLLWQWIGLALLFAIAVVIAWVAYWLVRRAIRPAVARTGTAVDDALLGALEAPLLVAFSVLFFAAGLPMLVLVEPVETLVQGLLKGLGVAAVAWAALRLVDASAQGLARRLEREGRRRVASIVPLGRRAAKIFLLVIAVIMLLQNVGLNVTGLIAGLGVGGIAVALAAQKTIENVFGGVSVITDQPVLVGDLCRFRDGGIGTVEEIGLRSTRIRTPDRTLVTIPNADFAQRELENFAARDRMRLYTILGLHYETTPEQLRAVLAALRDLLTAHPKVSAETVQVHLVGFGASSLNVEIAAYVATTDADQFNVIREELFLGAMDAVVGAGSGLAFPSQTVYLARDPRREKTDR